jgi:hypothetical protein
MRTTPRHLIRSLGPAALCLLAVGCGTMKIPQYPGGAGPRAQTRAAQGLAITADPFVDRQRAESYFAVNPEGKGVAIVYVRAENHSPDATWLVNEENMFLVDGAGTAGPNAHDQGVRGDYAAANAVGMAGAVVLSLPMLFASGKLTSDAMVKEKNFVDKEWRNQTLSPGQSAEGFVYFNFGKKTNWIENAALRIDSLNTRNQQTNTVIVPLSYETK